jgi:hypothetical protein
VTSGGCTVVALQRVGQQVNDPSSSAASSCRGGSSPTRRPPGARHCVRGHHRQSYRRHRRAWLRQPLPRSPLRSDSATVGASGFRGAGSRSPNRAAAPTERDRWGAVMATRALV